VSFGRGAGGGNCPTLGFLWAGQIFGTMGQRADGIATIFLLKTLA